MELEDSLYLEYSDSLWPPIIAGSGLKTDRLFEFWSLSREIDRKLWSLDVERNWSFVFLGTLKGALFFFPFLIAVILVNFGCKLAIYWGEWADLFEFESNLAPLWPTGDLEFDYLSLKLWLWSLFFDPELLPLLLCSKYGGMFLAFFLLSLWFLFCFKIWVVFV